MPADKREPAAADGPGAFELAVGALSRKERTVAELREWLLGRELEPAEVHETLDRLIAIGELDDERFALGYAQDKRELSGWGPDRIRRTLEDRGIERGLAERATRSESPARQVDRAAQLLLQRGSDVESDAGRRRALAYLARRGYDSEVAYDAVRAAARAG